MKPLISYYGGKQKMAHNIIELIPQHTVYVEPFCGGATILFGKPTPNITAVAHYIEVINDLDGDLINMYRCFQDENKSEKLIRKLQYTLYSREEHSKAVQILKKEIESTDIERAWAYYVSIQTSFSKILNASWGTGVFDQNQAKTWRNKILNLNNYLGRMAGIHIENDDALNVIKRWDSPQTFFYCDPPYVNTEQTYYKGYKESDLENLVNALSDCEGSFLLSSYRNDIVSKDWERFEFEAVCSAMGSSRGNAKDEGFNRSKKMKIENTKRTEIVWRRFNRVDVRPEIQKLYDSGKFDCFVRKGEKKGKILEQMELEL